MFPFLSDCRTYLTLAGVNFAHYPSPRFRADFDPTLPVPLKPRTSAVSGPLSARSGRLRRPSSPPQQAPGGDGEHEGVAPRREDGSHEEVSQELLQDHVLGCYPLLPGLLEISFLDTATHPAPEGQPSCYDAKWYITQPIEVVRYVQFSGPRTLRRHRGRLTGPAIARQKPGPDRGGRAYQI